MLTLLLLLLFVAAGAAFGPDTSAGRWCRRAIDALAQRLGTLTPLKALFLAVGVVAFVGLAYSLPAEIAWLLSVDVASALEVMASAALAASLLRLRRVRPVIDLVLARTAKPMERLARAARARRVIRPRRDADEGEPDPAWGFALA